MLAAVQEITPRFVVTLDTRLDANALLVRIPLAVTGKWVRGTSELTITRQDLEEIVRNFEERQNGEINVDYDHASEMPEVAAGGPIPSAGRIVKMDMPEPVGRGGLPPPAGAQSAPLPQPDRSRYILWGWYEPTERARALIRSREYRYISPALDWTARNKRTGRAQGTTLTSVALTNRPFLEELPEIRLSDPAYQPVEEVGEPPGLPPPAGADEIKLPRLQKQSTGGPMKQVTLSVVDGKIKIAHDDLQDEYFADPKELKKCLEELGLLSETALAGELQGLVGRPAATLSECLDELRQRLAVRPALTLAQAGALLSEADARGKFIAAGELFRAQVEQTLEEAQRAGKILPRRREEWRKIALADFPTFRKLMAEQRPVVPVRPAGFSGAGPGDVQAQVKFLAEQRMRERQVSFGQALGEISREQPDLMQQYRRAVSGTE